MGNRISRRALMANAAALAGMLTACKTAPAPDSAGAVNDALGDLDATGVAVRIRNSHITPQEALEAAIARANASTRNSILSLRRSTSTRASARRHGWRDRSRGCRR